MHTPSGVSTATYRPDTSLVDKVVEAIVREYHPQKVIVFGSFARGDTHELSDLDLIIVKETSESFFDRIARVRDASAGVPVDVQPLVYTEEELAAMRRRGNDFLETALEEGILAYEAPA